LQEAATVAGLLITTEPMVAQKARAAPGRCGSAPGDIGF
jgi:hypothetical protein